MSRLPGKRAGAGAGCVLLSLFSIALCVRAAPSETVESVLEQLKHRHTSGRPDAGILFYSAEERRIAFAHITEIYPTRTVRAGATPYPLDPVLDGLPDVSYELDGAEHSLVSFLARPATVGFIVVRGDDILLEHYARGHDESTLWMSFSVTKSVTSMLLGAAIHDGFIEHVDEPVARYLPRLRESPYQRSNIRHLLQMASGVAWNEDYDDPASDVALAGAANGLELTRYLAALPRAAAPGEVFNYNTAETNLAGEVLRAAIGNNAATYLTHRIWQPFGMEHDAEWVTSAAGAGETGGCCLNATLRDYARLGIFALHGGVLPDGQRVLPAGWMAQSTEPSPGNSGYGYFWWLYGDGTYSAQGIFEQLIFVDPDADLVIAAHANAPAAVGSAYGRHQNAVVQAIRRSLSED